MWRSIMALWYKSGSYTPSVRHVPRKRYARQGWACNDGKAKHAQAHYKTTYLVGDVSVDMVANDVLVVPFQRGREVEPDVGPGRVDTPVTRDAKVGRVMEAVDAQDPVNHGHGKAAPELAPEDGWQSGEEEEGEHGQLQPAVRSGLGEGGSERQGSGHRIA